MSEAFLGELERLAERVSLHLAHGGPSTTAGLALDLKITDAQLHLVLGLLLRDGKVELTPDLQQQRVEAVKSAPARRTAEQAMGEALSAFASADPTKESCAGVVCDPLSLAEAEHPSADPKAV